MGFQHRREAEAFLEALKERFKKFGLRLHPDKTRLIEFGRFACERRRERGMARPETFDFLGFTHLCSRYRNGRFRVVRQTMRKRMCAKLRAVRTELRRRMHRSAPEVGYWLRTVLRGHIQYYGVPGNWYKLVAFRYELIRAWRWALHRRGQRGYMTWDRMDRLVNRWLIPVAIVHPYPDKRLRGRTQGRSRMR